MRRLRQARRASSSLISLSENPSSLARLMKSTRLTVAAGWFQPHGSGCLAFYGASTIETVNASILKTYFIESMLHNLMRWVTAGLALVAVLSSIFLLLNDTFPHLLSIEHATSSAAPLLLIGAAYISLQPMVRPRPAELFKRLLLGFAFILWGIVQLFPPQ